MTTNTTYYKTVSVGDDGRLHSLYAKNLNGLDVVYIPGVWVFGLYPLFCWDNLQYSERWAGTSKRRQIWTCDVMNPIVKKQFSPPELYIAPAYAKEFWEGKNIRNQDLLSPRDVVLADQIMLIEMVREYGG